MEMEHCIGCDVLSNNGCWPELLHEEHLVTNATRGTYDITITKSKYSY